MPRGWLLLSAVGWSVFVFYWSNAARNSSPVVISESRKSRRVHELLVNIALLLLFIWPSPLAFRFLPAEPAIEWVGLTLQATFGALAVWSRRHLGAEWSGEITVKRNHRLIQSGPYRFVRHPIYTAMLGMFAGTTVVSGQWNAMFGLAIAVLAYWRKIRLEERNLRNAFGTAYDNYKHNTWFLFPGLY